MELVELPTPDTSSAIAAFEVVQAFSSPALVNHSLRAYLFAASYGLDNGVGFDAEVLYVAAMLHDLGLSDAFDSHRQDFETAGGNVAWAFTAGAGWPVERRDRAALAIIDHMRGDVDQAADPEGYLLMVSTSFDISGRRPEAWSSSLARDVLLRHPRLDLAARFVACFRDQATRKPDCAAALSVASGLAERMAANSLESLAQ